MCAPFSPDILQAGIVKGLREKLITSNTKCLVWKEPMSTPSSKSPSGLLWSDLSDLRRVVSSEVLYSVDRDSKIGAVVGVRDRVWVWVGRGCTYVHCHHQMYLCTPAPPDVPMYQSDSALRK